MDTFSVSSFFSICLLLMVGFVESKNNCTETPCGKLLIHFPFRIKNLQPKHCGYPGFDLECSSTNTTVLELPGSVKLNITNIDYRSQTIGFVDPYACLSMQLHNLTSSASPFQFKTEPHSLDQYTFFNCSSTHTDSSARVPCLSSSTFQVLAISSDQEITSLDDLLSCTKIPTPSSVPNDFSVNDKMRYLTWSNPMCKLCESKGKGCGFKNNTTTYETECFSLQKGIIHLLFHFICMETFHLHKPTYHVSMTI